MEKPKVTLGLIPDKCIENAVEISAFSITYSQRADCNSDKDEDQSLTIVAENNGMGEDGWYYSIKVENKWSIEDPEELAALLIDFKKRMTLNTHKTKDLKVYDPNKNK